MGFPSDPFKICKSHPDLDGELIGGTTIPLRRDRLDVDGDGKTELVVEYYQSVYKCPSEKTEKRPTKVELSELSTVRNGTLRFFSLDGKSGIEPFKTVVMNSEGKEFVALDFGYERAISWKGAKGSIDRSKISVVIVPLEVFREFIKIKKEAEGIAEEAKQTRSEKKMEEAQGLAVKAGAMLSKSRRLLNLGELTVSALPYKFD